MLATCRSDSTSRTARGQPNENGLSKDAFPLVRVVADVVGQALADNDQAQGRLARVGDPVGQAARTVADEITGADGVGGAADMGGGGALQHVDAFVLVVVDVEFLGLDR